MRLTPTGVGSNRALYHPRATQKLSFVQDITGSIGIYTASHVPTDKTSVSVHIRNPVN